MKSMPMPKTEQQHAYELLRRVLTNFGYEPEDVSTLLECPDDDHECGCVHLGPRFAIIYDPRPYSGGYGYLVMDDDIEHPIAIYSSLNEALEHVLVMFASNQVTLAFEECVNGSRA